MLNKVIWPVAGKYILAVSGGVDSVVLLDLLVSKAGPWKLIVAHFNHGIRDDSSKDEDLVKSLADNYGLEFVSAQGKLGEKTSEDKARVARYKFLRQMRKKYKADKIITAHHLDDRIETALFNIQRGTGRVGMIPFSKDTDLLRPLRDVYKDEIVAYAKKNKLQWVEDQTNSNLNYARNAIRRKTIPKIEKARPSFKTEFAKLLVELEADSNRIEILLEKRFDAIGVIDSNQIKLDRNALISMNLDLLNEFLYHCLRKLDAGAEIQKPQLRRLSHFCKTAKLDALCPVSGKLYARAKRSEIILSKDGRLN